MICTVGTRQTVTNMKQLAFLIPLVGGLAALGWFVTIRDEPETTRMVSQTGPPSIFAAGRIEGATCQIELRPGLHDRIAEILVQEGAQVAADQVLLRLADERYRHEVTLATSEVELENARLARLRNGARAEERAEAESLYLAKQAELQHAETALRRLSSLRREGAVTEQTADDQSGRVASLLASSGGQGEMGSRDGPGQSRRITIGGSQCAGRAGP